MRIVVAVDGLVVARQFEQCSCLTIYTVINGIITACQSVPNPGPPYDSLANCLASLDAAAILVGSLYPETAAAFRAVGIDVVGGEVGIAREAVDRYLTRTLIGADELYADEPEYSFAE